MKVYACLNGDFPELNSAAVRVDQSGLYYGAGCFETLLCRSGKIQYWSEHFNRLCRGLTYLGIRESDLPEEKPLYDNIINILQLNNLQDITTKIRIQCSIVNEQGYSPHTRPDYLTFITASELQARSDTCTLTVTPVRTIPAACRPSHLKLSNTLHFRDAYRKATQAGYQDALLLTTTGSVAETTIANIFWVKGDQVFTPSAECDILPGIIRDEMISYLRTDQKIKVTTGNYTPEHVLQSDAVWLTNSLMLAKPVTQIDQVFFDTTHPVLNRVLEHFSYNE